MSSLILPDDRPIEVGILATGAIFGESVFKENFIKLKEYCDPDAEKYKNWYKYHVSLLTKSDVRDKPLLAGSNMAELFSVVADFIIVRNESWF